MSKLIDLTGQKFGKLTVIKRAENNAKHGEIQWICKCDCGNIVTVIGKLLRNGEVKSCGCLKRNFNHYEIKDNICIATMSTGVKHIFDAEDYEKVKNISWFLTHKGYIYGIYNKKQIFIHQLITDFKYPMIDHKNGNKLDNRKSNLRPATKSQNAMNRHSRKSNKSGYLGVYWDKDRNKWVAKIGINRKTLNLGAYIHIDDAVKARLKAEKIYFKEFAPQKDLFEKYNI